MGLDHALLLLRVLCLTCSVICVNNIHGGLYMEHYG